MANEFRPTQRGEVIPDAVTVFISGAKAFAGWQSVSISKSIENVANSFSLSIDDPFQSLGTGWPIKPGVSIRVNIGEERVVTGFVDTIAPTFGPSSRSITITGRSKPGDLVDASVTGEIEFTNVTIDQLAEQLVAPFGLRVFLSVDPGKAFEKFAVKPGETYFEALNRAARTLGFFWISTRNGNIRLTRRGRARSFSELHQNVNIISGGASFDNSQRFSKYIIKGQSSGTDEFSGSSASQPEGTAEDRGITRFRELIVVAENNVNTEQAQTRAEWEASVRIAKAQEISCKVQGWLQEDGSLWGINQVVRFKSEFLGIDRDLLITSVTHSKDNNSGTITEISMTRTDAYDPQPVFKEEDDILSTLGAP